MTFNSLDEAINMFIQYAEEVAGISPYALLAEHISMGKAENAKINTKIAELIEGKPAGVSEIRPGVFEIGDELMDKIFRDAREEARAEVESITRTKEAQIARAKERIADAEAELAWLNREGPRVPV